MDSARYRMRYSLFHPSSVCKSRSEMASAASCPMVDLLESVEEGGGGLCDGC